MIAAPAPTLSEHHADTHPDHLAETIRRVDAPSGLPSAGETPGEKGEKGEKPGVHLAGFDDAVVRRPRRADADGQRHGRNIFSDLHRIPYPTDDMSARIREHVDAALEERDAEALLGVLMLGSVRIPESQRCQVAWLPALIGMEELRTNDRPLFREHQIHRYIKEEVRKMLAKAPNDPYPTWVVPIDPIDRCAAHIAALIMTQHGRSARPWLWRNRPPADAWVTIGSRAPSLGDDSVHGLMPHLHIIGSDLAGSMLALSSVEPTKAQDHDLMICSSWA